VRISRGIDLRYNWRGGVDKTFGDEALKEITESEFTASRDSRTC
jgi:hypothetical protein